MGDVTARLKLPMIRAGQAQKELSHNEALALIDLLTQANVLAVGVEMPPSDPVLGEAWIVGAAPGGAWAGKAQQLAGWTEGGWRFAVPVEGMRVWVNEAFVYARFSSGAWTLGEVVATRLVIGGVPVVGSAAAAIADPAGGGVIDSEARATAVAILAALRSHGLIGS